MKGEGFAIFTSSLQFLVTPQNLTQQAPWEVPSLAEFCPCAEINVLSSKQLSGRMKRNGEV